LPIRHGFAEQAKALTVEGRTSPAGKEYQQQIRQELNIATEKQCVLVMGGGEGVGSLSDIVNELYLKLRRGGVDATICVVCGRNEKLQNELSTKYNKNNDVNVSTSDIIKTTGRKRRFVGRLFSKIFRRTSHNDDDDDNDEELSLSTNTIQRVGDVDIVPLGFLTNIPEYMVAADVLVTKAGPGTIAEAAAVGLPVMMTSFLPGQEAGNVDIVLDGEFGAYYKNPKEGAQEVARWLNDSLLLDVMSQKSAAIGHPNAASEIVQEIGQVTHSLMNQ